MHEIQSSPYEREIWHSALSKTKHWNCRWEDGSFKTDLIGGDGKTCFENGEMDLSDRILDIISKKAGCQNKGLLHLCKSYSILFYKKVTSNDRDSPLANKDVK